MDNHVSIKRRVFTAAEVAEQIATSTKTVYRLIQRGLLERVSGIRHIRITAESLERFLTSTQEGQ